MAAEAWTIVFDGTCNFCNGSVRFISKRDRRKRFTFVPSQSPQGQELAARHGFTGPTPGSILLIVGNTCYSRSTASLQIARRMDGLWHVFFAFVVIPRPIRDGMYKWFAARRHRFFGKAERCELPPASSQKSEALGGGGELRK
jgi:predicted DCC family thiol-disulfide oxidoreductase YuxK